MSGRDPGVGRDQAPPRESLTAAMVLAVAAGGMAGTLARWLLVEVVPSPADSPVPGWLMLSVVNLLGAFLLGLLTARASRRPLPRWLRAGLGVGVL
ncbi:CrcB family protein, partial [Citricoccus sp.]|uniref:CrcB family protein n=1 Tax=Citricoccus sp. TaxID=1978372 RepID=UPI002C943DBF